jgi:hypothetical protein
MSINKADEAVCVVSVRIKKSRKKYVDCLTYKNIVWPLFSYENPSNANSKKKYFREKVQGEKVKVAKKP